MLPAIDEGRFVARILAMSIGAEPVVRPDAKMVCVDRHDLAVQLRELVQPNTDSYKRSACRVHRTLQMDCACHLPIAHRELA